MSGKTEKVAVQNLIKSYERRLQELESTLETQEEASINSIDMSDTEEGNAEEEKIT